PHALKTIADEIATNRTIAGGMRRPIQSVKTGPFDGALANAKLNAMDKEYGAWTFSKLTGASCIVNFCSAVESTDSVARTRRRFSQTWHHRGRSMNRANMKSGCPAVFSVHAIALFFFASVGTFIDTASHAADTPRTNVLFIVSDDLNTRVG